MDKETPWILIAAVGLMLFGGMIGYRIGQNGVINDYFPDDSRVEVRDMKKIEGFSEEKLGVAIMTKSGVFTVLKKTEQNPNPRFVGAILDDKGNVGKV